MTGITRDIDQLINEVSSLDIYDIRTNIINFLQNQTQFTDYNFEGSNLSILLDILSYYTFYKGFYVNGLASEMFLPTAVQRTSAVARAKQEGYVPESVRSAVAYLLINLTSTSGSPLSITIPAGTIFTVQQPSGAQTQQRYTFSTLQSFTAYPNINQSGVYTPAITSGAAEAGLYISIPVVEGQPITQSVTITTDTAEDPIVLDNQNIDTTTLLVSVLATPSSPLSSATIYNLPTDFIATSGSSNVYFLEEIENLQYQIYFGDGVIGRALVNNNVVNIQYNVSSGPDANGANTFNLSTPIPGASLSNVSGYPGITVTTPASGGSTIETVVSIKTNAPLSWQTQQRAVTPQDYISLIKKNFDFVQAISVWGGQDNIPVALGYVFICILPQGSEPVALTDDQKTQIETLFNTSTVPGRYGIVAVQPVVVDPDVVFIDVATTVIYNPQVQNNPAGLATLVANNILAFNSTFQDFGDYFRYSRMVGIIDNTDPSIDNSLSVITLEKRGVGIGQASYSTSTPETYTLNYYNAISPGTINSTPFIYPGAVLNSITSGGSNYAVGDVITAATGAGSPEATFLVTETSTLPTGPVVEMLLLTPGYYPASSPTGNNYPGAATTGGSGTSLTINLTVYTYPSCKLADDGNGNLLVKYLVGDVPTSPTIPGFPGEYTTDTTPMVAPLPSIGTVSYNAGTIYLSNFSVAPPSVQPISIFAGPAINDIYSTTSGILVMDQQSVTVTAQADTVLIGS